MWQRVSRGAMGGAAGAAILLLHLLSGKHYNNAKTGFTQRYGWAADAVILPLRPPPHCARREKPFRQKKPGLLSESRLLIKNIQSAYFISTASARSLSTSIRPQFSQIIIFLRCLISLCFCGGMALKQPPQASRSTGTTARPLR